MTDNHFILIPGRTSKQGTALNEGKYTASYQDECNNLSMDPQDMQRLGFKVGDRVTVRSASGLTTLNLIAGAKDELPAGMVFVPYGPPICVLVDGDTHGSGMPGSKSIDVTIERVADV